jgi:hypothetical protein
MHRVIPNSTTAAGRALARATTLLKALGVTLNADKTRIVAAGPPRFAWPTRKRHSLGRRADEPAGDRGGRAAAASGGGDRQVQASDGALAGRADRAVTDPPVKRGGANP